METTTVLRLWKVLTNLFLYYAVTSSATKKLDHYVTLLIKWALTLTARSIQKYLGNANRRQDFVIWESVTEITKAVQRDRRGILVAIFPNIAEKWGVGAISLRIYDFIFYCSHLQDVAFFDDCHKQGRHFWELAFFHHNQIFMIKYTWRKGKDE